MRDYEGYEEVEDNEGVVEMAFMFMLRNMGNKLKISEIAKGIGYSQSHLQNKFIEKTGTAIGETFKNMRMEHSKDLLINSNLSITGIAERMGMTVDEFRRYLKDGKRGLGMSPKKYRTEQRNKRVDILIMFQQAINQIEFDIHSLLWNILGDVFLAKNDPDVPVLDEVVADSEIACLEEYVIGGFDRIGFLEKSYSINPTNPLTNVLLGVQCHIVGNNPEAEEYFRTAIEASKVDKRFLTQPECELIYGMFLHSINEGKAARIVIDAAEKLPGSYLGQFYSGLYTLHGEKRFAFELLKSEMDAYYQGEYDQEEFEDKIADIGEEIQNEAILCEAFFTRAIELNPEFAQAYYYRSYVFYCLNKKNESDSDYRMAKRLNDALCVQFA